MNPNSEHIIVLQQHIRSLKHIRDTLSGYSDIRVVYANQIILDVICYLDEHMHAFLLAIPTTDKS